MLNVNNFWTSINIDSITTDHNDSNLIKKYSECVDNLNRELNHLEKYFIKAGSDSNNEIIKERSRISEAIIGCLNKIEENYTEFLKDKKLLVPPKKVENIDNKFQLLKIKAGLAAITSGTADWEEYELSCEIYKNTENFIDSDLCKLSADKLGEHHITAVQRKEKLYICQYNFAYALAYYNIGEPGDKDNIDFYSILNKLPKEHLFPEAAIAITNSFFAEKICRESFGKKINENDLLLNSIKK